MCRDIGFSRDIQFKPFAVVFCLSYPDIRYRIGTESILRDNLPFGFIDCKNKFDLFRQAKQIEVDNLTLSGYFPRM
jgi:hypothetical protein